MKHLVTGGAGFVGSHTCDALFALGHTLCVTDIVPPEDARDLPPGVRYYPCDIRDGVAVRDIFRRERPEVLVHLAAQVSVPASVEKPVEDAMINIIGTLNLLEAGRENGLRRVVYASSAAVYGEPVYLPIDEAHPLNMQVGYGVSKHTAEHYLRVYRHLYGISWAALRYANVYGPRQKSGEGALVSAFADAYAKGRPFAVFGDGEQTRDFVYVKDVARANAMAAASDAVGIFQVCTGVELSINEMIGQLNELCDVDRKPEYQPPRDGDVRRSCLSRDKAERELGWTPRYSFAEGLRETLAYYRDRA